MINILIGLLLGILAISCKNDQIAFKDTPKSYSNYLDLAEKSYDNNHLDSTYFYLIKLRFLFPQIPADIDSSKVGLSNTLFGFYYEDINQPDSALYYYQLAYQDKIKYFKGNHPEVSKSINNIGLLYQKYGEYPTARSYFLEALSLVMNFSNYKNEYTKYSLNLGNNYYLENDFTSSLKLLKNLSAYSDIENLGNIYLAIANNYIGLKEFDKSLSYFHKAYHLEDKNLRRKAQLANNIGNAYSRLNQENLALYYYNQSLEIRRNIKNISNNEYGEIYANISSSLLIQNELTFAHDNLSISKRYYLENNPINQAALAGIEENFGQLHLKKNDIEAALKSYKQAQFIHDSILFTPGIENGYRYLNLASIYMMPPFRDTLRGLYYLEKINDASSKSIKIDKLLLLTSISIQTNKFKEAKSNLLEIKNQLSNHSFENPIKQIETILQIASFYEKMNNVKESRIYNIKGLNLINQLPCTDEIDFYHNILKYYQIETLLFLKEKKYLTASIVAQDKYLFIDSIQKINSKVKKDRLVNEIKRSFIDYFFDTKTYDKKELLKFINYPYSKDKFPKIGKKVLFIRYWLTQNNLIIWTKTDEKAEVIIKKLDVPLDKTILSVRNAIRELPLAGDKSKKNYEVIYQNLIEKLSNLLVPEIPDGIQNIVLFPEHILTILPFEILFEKKGNHIMLIEKYAISYHNIMTDKINKSNKSLKREVLAFSPNFQGDDRGFANLKYSEIEIQKISKHLPTIQIKNKKASVINFINEAPKYNIIHIATHSDPNLNAEEGGELIFTKNKEKKEPSSLNASQISSLKIGANLVVLSACQSAIGGYTPSQGMNSIAQSFLNGGASSVITSLWQVDDRTTAEFMNIFYYYLSKGFPKNKALQFTKKKMINQAPYYWAPFILIGDSGNI